jgi:DNA-binding FrmR family transcriptional regulator
VPEVPQTSGHNALWGYLVAPYTAGMAGYSHDKTGVIGRLRRIEGQVRGIQKMVEEDRYCIDVLTQVNAARAGLESVALFLLRDHTEYCVSEAIRAGDGTARVRELSEAVERLVRS